jgi:formate hydrogenlyase subunit 6/NADH:ubiquinone oxidoreductase subunit I
MDYVNALERGDIALAADLSFDCIRCGLCALRCPAEIVQYNAAIMARRLYAKYLAPKAKQLQKRLEEINQGSFEKEINELMALDRKTLSEKYYKREIKLK